MTNPPGVTRARDLLFVDCGGGRMVVACDSLGGIGPKPGDAHAVDARTCGYFVARVPLLEVLCAGATPIVVADNLCVEEDPTGREITEAIREVASSVGVAPESVTGSTEENVVTQSTGIGITVLGWLPPDVESRRATPGDVVLCLGCPRSAPHDRLYVGHPDMVDMAELSAALRSGLIHDALPVGSKGAGWEAGLLAQSAGCEFVARSGDFPLVASGGPSSCVLVACRAGDVEELAGYFASTLPIVEIGHLRA